MVEAAFEQWVLERFVGGFGSALGIELIVGLFV